MILHNSEVVDGQVAHPVKRPALELELARAKRVRTTQAVAVATTGFVAGVAATAIVRNRTKAVHKRSVFPSRQKSRSKKAHRHNLPVLGTKSFLVDIHLLDR